MNGNSVFVLYRVANCGSDESGTSYNAFEMPRNRTGGVTLADIKRNCTALRSLSHAGPDGYHWRVRMDEKGQRSTTSYSWWDIQDDAAKLPIKESVPLSELERLYITGAGAAAGGGGGAGCGGGTSSSGGGGSGGGSGSTKSALGGAMRTLGKAVNTVATTVDQTMLSAPPPPDPNEPRVSVIAFKLLDLVKLQDEFQRKHGGGGGGGGTFEAAAARRSPPSSGGNHHLHRGRSSSSGNAAPLPTQQQTRPTPRHQAQAPRVPPPPRRASPVPPAAHQQQQQQQPRGPTRVQVPPPRAAAVPTKKASSAEADLMGFVAGPTPAAGSKAHLHHSTSMPSTFSNETKQQKLQREYRQNAQKQNRVWDDVDQRWVVVEGTQSKGGTTAAPPSSAATKASQGETKIKGLSMEDSARAAASKSIHVQTAVRSRMEEMEQAKAKAKQELRERESQKKKSEDEEDIVRRKLEPKVKAWSEEHGKKKQLAALLASLHMILWQEANWKQVNLGDLLDDKKLRRCYKRATLKVHPDKTSHLDPEKRFIAKRVFDALSQAMTQYEDGKR